MSRTKGQDKQATERRAEAELIDFNAREIKNDSELLSLVAKLLEERFDRPPDLVINIKEIAERIRKYAEELINR